MSDILGEGFLDRAALRAADLTIAGVAFLVSAFSSLFLRPRPWVSILDAATGEPYLRDFLDDEADTAPILFLFCKALLVVAAPLANFALGLMVFLFEADLAADTLCLVGNFLLGVTDAFWDLPLIGVLRADDFAVCDFTRVVITVGFLSLEWTKVFLTYDFCKFTYFLAAEADSKSGPSSWWLEAVLDLERFDVILPWIYGCSNL